MLEFPIYQLLISSKKALFDHWPRSPLEDSINPFLLRLISSPDAPAAEAATMGLNGHILENAIPNLF